jgi:hypothetical protein
MKLLQYITVLLSLVFLPQTSASSESDFITIICDECNTNASYGRAAAFINEGTVVVINTKTFEAKAFYIIYEPLLGGSNPVPTSLPNEVDEALLIYEDFVSALNNFQYEQANSQSSSSLQQLNSNNFDSALSLSSSCTANGCGTGWNLYLVPDFPYTEACNAHDTCYCSDASKSACDSAFLESMRDLTQDLLNSNSTILLNKLLSTLLEIHLNARAEIYHLAVLNAEGAREAYCDNTTANSPGECNEDIFEGTIQGDLFTTVNRVFASNGGTDGINLICELWQYPDGNGGYYYLEQNCVPI